MQVRLNTNVREYKCSAFSINTWRREEVDNIIPRYSTSLFSLVIQTVYANSNLDNYFDYELYIYWVRSNLLLKMNYRSSM